MPLAISMVVYSLSSNSRQEICPISLVRSFLKDKLSHATLWLLVLIRLYDPMAYARASGETLFGKDLCKVSVLDWYHFFKGFCWFRHIFG